MQYILEGSVQRAGDTVRVNVQFIDALNGGHLWAQRYDRQLNEIFAIQDEITREVTATLGAYEGTVAEAYLARAKRKAETNLSAYELVLLAREHRHRFNKQDNAEALELLEKAIELDSQYGRAYVGLAWTHAQDYWQGFVDTRDDSLDKALESAQRAVEMDPLNAEGHWVLADIYLSMGDTEKGIASYRRAIDLNPNLADMLVDWGGFVLPEVLGKPEEGIEILKRAKRLSPHIGDWYNRAVQTAYHFAGRYDESISAYSAVKYPTFSARLMLVASYAHAGRLEEAPAEAAMILESNPEFKLSEAGNNLYTDAAKEHLREGLREAGLTR